jgi:hypothetical protein
MTLRYVGSPDARRFFIERKDGCVWAGDQWSIRRQDAVLWARLRDAHAEYNRLQLLPYLGQQVKEFECRLFTLEKLREYLQRACRLTMDVEAQGYGPVEGTFTIPMAMFDSLREVVGW